MSKWFSVLLSILMSLSLCVINVSAEEDLFEGYTKVYTIEDLYAINDNLSGKYVLENDIDLANDLSESGFYSYLGNGWKPIGGTDLYGRSAFTGIFDGNGHTIKGLSIDLKTIPKGYGVLYLGLFAYNEGLIKNLKTVDGQIGQSVFSSKRVYGGGIVGYNNGTIENCSNANSIHLKTSVTETISTPGYESQTYSYCYAGGVTGYNAGEITRSSNFGNILAESSISGTTKQYEHACSGGIAGGNSSTISKSFNAGKVGEQFLQCKHTLSSGGIAGDTNNSKSSILDCYNCGDIYAINNGNITGGGSGITTGGGNISNCYTLASEKPYDVVIGPSNSIFSNCYFESGSGTSMTGLLELAKNQLSNSTYFKGFDFENSWFIDTNTSYPYPQLKDNPQDLEKRIDTVEWETIPKQDYCKYSDLDINDGRITVYYVDNTSDIISLSKDMVSGYDLSVSGVQTVQVTYKGFTLVYDITVKEIRSVEEVSGPDKTEFVRGTQFDFTGWKIRVICDDGTIEYINVTPDMTTGGNINASGEYKVVFAFNGREFNKVIKVMPIKVLGISIKKLPDRTVFETGENLDVKGMIVNASYNNGVTEEITNYTLNGYTSTLGKHTITVQHQNFTDTFDVVVEEGVPLTLEVSKMPVKTTYVEGQLFDSSGMVVKAVYASGFTKEIHDYDISNIPSGLGTKKLSVSYKGASTYFYVTVVSRIMTSIGIVDNPAKIQFIEGETLDVTGLKVKAYYNDDTESEIEDYVVSSVDMNELGAKTVTVQYEGFTDTFNINVIGKSLVNLTITKPTKLEYYPDEELDLTGLKVYANYNNGKSVELKSSEYTVEGSTAVTGNNIITIKYNNKSTSFVVEVHTPSGEWVTTKEATCTETGTKVQYCTDCGKVCYTETIEKSAHTEVVDPAVAATCTTAGKTEGSHCSVCNEVIVAQQVIDPLGHDYGGWETVTSPTCVDKGSKKRTCTVCGHIETRDIEANGHTWETSYTVDKEATCTTQGSKSIHCQNCDTVKDVTVVPVLEHQYSSKVTKEATCTEAGVTTYTCALCGDTYTRVIPMVEHIYKDRITAPGCLTSGYTTHTCTLCGDSYKDTYVMPAGHSYSSTVNKQATCTEAGSKTNFCVNCGDTNVETIPAFGHTEVTDKAVAATCTEVGLTKGTHCSTCGTILVAQKETEALGHTYGSWKTVVAPTCEEDGYKTKTCVDCGHVQKQVLDATGHDWATTYTIDKKPTCTTEGKKSIHCFNCENTKNAQTIEALGHTEVTDPAIAATCTATGKTAGTHCSVCNEVIVVQKTVPAKGHTASTVWSSDGTYHWHLCTTCKGVMNKAAHTPAFVVTKATLTANGKVVKKCSTCAKVLATATVYMPKTFALSATSYVYDGKVKTPTLTVKDSAGKVIPTTSYTLTRASGRTVVGKYAYKIVFKGNYSGTKTVYFTIVPKTTTIKALAATSKGFKVTLNKQATQTTGYQIQYSLYSNFASPKAVTITKNTTLTSAVSKLTAKKKYYVRVRTYKTVSKVNYYSSWSAAKYVTTKA